MRIYGISQHTTHAFNFDRLPSTFEEGKKTTNKTTVDRKFILALSSLPLKQHKSDHHANTHLIDLIDEKISDEKEHRIEGNCEIIDQMIKKNYGKIMNK